MFKRDLFYELKKYLAGRQALVINGMRQVGKTTILKQLFDEIISPNKLFLDLENPLNQKYFEEIDYGRININIHSLLGISPREKIYLFLDEIQNVAQLPSILKYLGDHYNYKFFLTGSVSFYLKNLFSESMAGRKFLFNLPPLSFKEFLRMKQIKLKIPLLNEKISEVIFRTVQPYYEEYVHFGAFPAVIRADNRQEKIKQINEIFTAYFEKEVINFADFRKNRTIRDLLLLLLRRTGQKFDSSKLCSELGITRITLSEYLAFLEGTFFIKFIRPFSHGLDAEIRETPKIYTCDSGLANIIGKAEFGQVFETAICHQLDYQNQRLKKFPDILNYYRKKSGKEIDFVFNKKTGIEVKETADKEDEKKLKRLALELKLKDSFVVSYNYARFLKTVYGFQL